MRERNDGPLRKIRDQRRGCCLEKTRVINCNAANRQKIATRPRVARSCRARASRALYLAYSNLSDEITHGNNVAFVPWLKNEIPARKRACARASLPRTFDFSTLMALYTRSQCCVCGIATCGRAFYLPTAHVVRREFRKKKEKKKENLARESSRARNCQLLLPVIGGTRAYFRRWD